MGKFGTAAVGAAQMLSADPAMAPRVAWDRSAMEVFPLSSSSRAKGCPRDAFLALCEMGVLPNVPSGDYTRSKRNKSYATVALDALRRDPALANDERRLWSIAVAQADKSHNAQLDVLIALWRGGFIR